MLPVDGQLANPGVAAGFLPPRHQLRQPLEDWSRGGLGLNDATQGLDLRDWRFRYDRSTRQLFAGVPNLVAESLVFTTPAEADEISGAFDTNMQPVVGWTHLVGGGAFFRWFDPIALAFATVPLAAGTYNVRICLDDPRTHQRPITDTIITYLRAGSLYYRQLRDRFGVERLLRTGLDDYRLAQFGMNRKLRLQWQVHKPVAA